MGIIGSSWKDEESFEEKYENITGNKLEDRDKYLRRRQIEKDIDDSYTSDSNRRDLRDLLSDLDNN